MDVLLHPLESKLLIKKARIDYPIAKDFITGQEAESTKLH